MAAAYELLQQKGISQEEIGALVFASHGPDYKRPATAHVLQKRLCLPEHCACFDISLGCSAFVYGTQILGGLMQTSDIQKALLIVGDTNSKLFSDGYDRTLYNLFMDGFGVFEYTIREVPRILKDYIARENKKIGEYDYYVMHQANQYILQQLSKRVKLDPKKMLYSIQDYGNTSSASVPLTLCKYFGKEEEGEVSVLMSGFGVGLSCGVMSTCLNKKDIFPIIESDDYFKEGIINGPEDWQLERETNY